MGGSQSLQDSSKLPTGRRRAIWAPATPEAPLNLERSPPDLHMLYVVSKEMRCPPAAMPDSCGGRQATLSSPGGLEMKGERGKCHGGMSWPTHYFHLCRGCQMSRKSFNVAHITSKSPDLNTDMQQRDKDGIKLLATAVRTLYIGAPAQPLS